jgi:hypothetical protein
VVLLEWFSPIFRTNRVQMYVNLVGQGFGGVRISASTAKSVRSEHLMAADVYSFGMICHELDWMYSFQRVPHFRL